MFRRRRPQRDKINFGFDSFLDLVANVIGIVIRLILVAWVGAQSYSATMQWLQDEPPPPLPPAQVTDDPLHQQLAHMRQELAQAKTRLMGQLRQVPHLRQNQEQVNKELQQVAAQRQDLARQRQLLDHALANKGQTLHNVHLSLDDLRQRSQELVAQIKTLEKAPSQKKVLRYRTPVSRPVHIDEILFECKAGRVTYVDLPAFMAEVKQTLEQKAEELRRQWQVVTHTAPVGAFRLAYTLERERALFDSLLNGAGPTSHDNFRYGLSRWVIEPILSVRGETAEAALASGSAFRQLVDSIDPQQTVVTFCVYSDSFNLYRRLRDFLYERDVEVAGRPLPEDMPIAASRHGSASRGQ